MMHLRAPTGPLVLTINRVGAFDHERQAWTVRAGEWVGYVRFQPLEGIDWMRVRP